MKCLCAALVAVLVSLWVVEPAAAQRTYNKPTYRDDRLDWCLHWANNCGKPAADAFCNRRRFTAASDFRIALNIGRTRLIGTNQICNSPACDGFESITCVDPIPFNRVFANPTWGNMRLDNCLRWAADCGKPAADAFCRSKGFGDALSFETDAEPGMTPTRVITGDVICRGRFCVGFQQIICR